MPHLSPKLLVFALVVVGVAVGCGGDGGSNRTPVGPLDAGADGDTDTDTDADTDADSETDAIVCDLGTHEGGVDVSSASDLEVLAGYTAIAGKLKIEECDSCIDLSQLVCLEEVTGGLRIVDNPMLENIDGLSSVASTGEVVIVENPSLMNVNLESLSTANTFSISGNHTLFYVNASALTALGGSLIVADNGPLSNLDGLSGIASIYGSVSIVSSGFLADIDGLAALTSVSGGIHITGNTALDNIDGLGSLSDFDGSLTVHGNSNLADCKVCNLINTFEAEPIAYWVYDNLDDSCTPVPTSCPGWDAGPDASPDGGK